MDHPMLDRMQAFLIRNERKSTECSPYLNDCSNSQTQSFCYPQLSERNGSMDFNQQLSTPVNPRKSISSNYSYDGLGKETPSAYLPSYVYQYGHAPFLQKMPSSLHGTHQLNTGNSFDLSPANKENSMSLFDKTIASAKTPTRRKASTPYSQASNTKRTDYSPAQNKSVSSFKVPGSEKKSSYVDQQTKFMEKIKSNARKDASKAFKSRVSTPSPQRNAIPRLDIAHLSKNGSKTSLSSREHSIDKKSIGNVTFDNIKVKSNDYTHTRKDAIEGLLKKNPKKVAVTQTKPNPKLKTFKPKQEEFVYEENQPRSKSPAPKKVVRDRSSSKKELKDVVKKEPIAKSKITQSKSVQRLSLESKKKLNTSESLAEIHESYKEEIQNLIKTIKSEKAQITTELEKMSKELKKYKKAYKKMKKEFREKKSNSQENSKPSVSQDSTERKDDDYAAKEENDLNDSINNDLEDEGPSNFNGTSELPLLIETLEKVHIVEERELKPRSVQREQKEEDVIDSQDTRESRRKSDLMSQMNTLNQDVENILNGVRPDYNSTRNFEFKNTDALSCIVTRLAIDPKIFQKENIKQDADVSKLDVQDIIVTQQQMIQFLVKKLQDEENQRLKTEEQTQEMINSMEITIKNLEENKFMSRRRDNTPNSLMETNKSFSSVIN